MYLLAYDTFDNGGRTISITGDLSSGMSSGSIPLSTIESLFRPRCNDNMYYGYRVVMKKAQLYVIIKLNYGIHRLTINHATYTCTRGAKKFFHFLFGNSGRRHKRGCGENQH